jgi:hypothetical protein
MRLNEIKFEEIRIGQRVKSLNTFVEGEITGLIPMTEHPDEDDNIWIKWDNGKESCLWHFLGNSIELI